MKKRFVFASEVRALLARGEKKLELPEGAKFSPEAADLIKEKGIQIIFVGRHKGSGSQHNEDTREKGRDVTPSVLVAVASRGKRATDYVSDVAARTPFFLLFNEHGEMTEAVKNPYQGASTGVGPTVAKFLAEKGVSTVVAGNFGVNIKKSLDERGIAHIEFQGKAGEAIQEVLSRSV